jgi:hypothetical protein
VLSGPLVWFWLILGRGVAVGVGDGACWSRFLLLETCLIVRRWVGRIVVGGGGVQVSAAMLV